MLEAGVIVDLTRRIEYAAIMRDWLLLSALDEEVAAALAVIVPDALTPQKTQALLRLQQVHRVVMEACERELGQTAAKLAHLREHKDGWRAYASDDDWKEAAA